MKKLDNIGLISHLAMFLLTILVVGATGLVAWRVNNDSIQESRSGEPASDSGEKPTFTNYEKVEKIKNYKPVNEVKKWIYFYGDEIGVEFQYPDYFGYGASSYRDLDEEGHGGHGVKFDVRFLADDQSEDTTNGSRADIYVSGLSEDYGIPKESFWASFFPGGYFKNGQYYYYKNKPDLRINGPPIRSMDTVDYRLTVEQFDSGAKPGIFAYNNRAIKNPLMGPDTCIKERAYVFNMPESSDVSGFAFAFCLDDLDVENQKNLSDTVQRMASTFKFASE